MIAAGGVRAHNVASLVRRTAVREVHGSAWELEEAPAGALALGVAGGTARRRTKLAQVRAVVEALRVEFQ